MAKVTCRSFAEMGVARRAWEAAWTPAETILRYSILGIVSGGTLLLPAAMLLERAALVVPLLLTSGGLTAGYLRWRFSRTYVNEEYGVVLGDSCSIRREAPADSTVYLSSPSASETQDGIVPATRYSLTLIEEASDWILITDVKIDTRTFEVVTESTKVATERVKSQTFSNGTYRLESSRGIWTVTGLNAWSGEQLSVDDWKETT